MPLHDGYGVGIGTFNRFEKDSPVPGHYGSFFHGFVFINIPNGSGGTRQFKAAVDVNTPTDGIEYFAPTNLDKTLFTPISLLSSGFHYIQSRGTSGALDYIRNKLISIPMGCLALIIAVLGLRDRSVWKHVTGAEALNALESLFNNPGDIERVYLFGEPFKNDSGLITGVHNVHYNQGNARPEEGDPDYGRKMGWYREGGIWQDGAVIVKYRSDNRLAGFFVKFVVQSLRTDDNGHPV